MQYEKWIKKTYTTRSHSIHVIYAVFLFVSLPFIFVQDAILKISDHERQTLVQGNLRLPVQKLLCFTDIWLPLMRIVGSVRFEFNLCTWINGFFHNLLFQGEISLLVHPDQYLQWRSNIYVGQTSASSNIVNSPGLPKLNGPTCSFSINATSPSTCHQENSYGTIVNIIYSCKVNIANLLIFAVQLLKIIINIITQNKLNSMRSLCLRM